MGQFEIEGISDIKERKTLANKTLNSCDGLKNLCLLFQQKIDELANCEEKRLSDVNLELELEVRLVCNSLISFLLYTNDDPFVREEFVNLDN